MIKMERKMLLPVLDYFGTSLDSAGHFFWELKGESMSKSEIWFNKIPFNPEELLPNYMEKGTVKYFYEGDYKICAISGSCIDKRSGTKSVFWTEASVNVEDFKVIILSIPIAKKIIEKMPFEVKW